MQSQTIVAAIHRPDNQIVLVTAHKPVPVITKRTVSYRISRGTGSFNNLPKSKLDYLNGTLELHEFHS